MKNGYETNHIWASNVMSISLDTWKKLTPAQQATIEPMPKPVLDEMRKRTALLWETYTKPMGDDAIKALKEYRAATGK